MTFEEVEQAIQQMLTVQRELQESQLRLAERQADHDRWIEQFRAQMAEQQEAHVRRMAEHTQWLTNFRQVIQDQGERQIRVEAEQDRQERILNRLIGYSLANETDHLNLEERLIRLEQRIEQIRGT